MSEQDNVQVIQNLYAAFGRGDMAALMDALADDVVWILPGPSDLPFNGTFRGKAGVQEWLGNVMENLEFRAFEPQAFLTQGDKVAVVLRSAITLKRTGIGVEGTEVHLYTLRDGQVVWQRSYEDTAALADAYRGSQVPATEKATASAPAIQAQQ